MLNMTTGAQGPGMWYRLSTQTQSLDQLGVARHILALQVVEQLAALVHHADQAAA